MKKTYKIISYISIIIFVILWISSKIMDINQYNTADIRILFIVVSLFTSWKYSQIENNEKDEIISSLKKELGRK